MKTLVALLALTASGYGFIWAADNAPIALAAVLLAVAGYCCVRSYRAIQTPTSLVSPSETPPHREAVR